MTDESREKKPNLNDVQRKMEIEIKRKTDVSGDPNRPKDLGKFEREEVEKALEDKDDETWTV